MMSGLESVFSIWLWVRMGSGARSYDTQAVSFYKAWNRSLE